MRTNDKEDYILWIAIVRLQVIHERLRRHVEYSLFRVLTPLLNRPTQNREEVTYSIQPLCSRCLSGELGGMAARYTTNSMASIYLLSYEGLRRCKEHHFAVWKPMEDCSPDMTA